MKNRKHKAFKTRPNYGITRVDQIEKKTHGWNVRIRSHYGSGLSANKFFSDKKCGGRKASRKLALEFRAQCLAAMPDKRRRKVEIRIGMARKEPPNIAKLEAELEEVSKLRNKLYWEFVRGKNSPPVPAEVTRKYYGLTEQIRKLKTKTN